MEHAQPSRARAQLAERCEQSFSDRLRARLRFGNPEPCHLATFSVAVQVISASTTGAAEVALPFDPQAIIWW
jgi:hypothetical protein